MSDLKTNLQEILQEKQDKIIPENIKKDVQIFDVTGTYEGSGSSTTGVKLFETEEEMQADSTAKEGDLAVVYREEIQNMTADTQTQYITFPETVTLPEAVTSSYNCMLRAVDSSAMLDGQVRLNSTSFRFEGYIESGMITVQYTSTDGMNYTRTSFQGDSGDLTNPVDLGTVIGVYRPEQWNDSMGYFMQTGGMTFDGLYEYSKTQNIKDTLEFKINIQSDGSGDSVNLNVRNVLNLALDKFPELGLFYTINPNTILYVEEYENNEVKKAVFCPVGSGFGILVDNTNNILCNKINSTSTDSYGKYVIDVDNNNVTKETVLTEVKTITSGDNSYNFTVGDDITNKPFTSITYREDTNEFTSLGSLSVYSIPLDGTDIEKKSINLYSIPSYEIASNQYTLTSSNQLLPDISAYGKNGNITGDGSITNATNSFDDIPAMLYSQIQAKYDNMEPRVLTDEDKEIDDNIYIIPTKSDGTVLLDTSQVTNMNNMFNGCSNLTEVPTLNTSQATDMMHMFNGCSNLTKVSLLDTADVTNMRGMFYGCSNLKNIPLLDTSNVVNMNGMFNGCKNLTAILLLDTSAVTNMNAMFYGCTSLTTIPQLDTSAVTNMNTMFYGCTSLSNDSLNNILAMLTNATAYTETKTLKSISLSETQATTCTTLSNWTACEAAGWTTGY